MKAKLQSVFFLVIYLLMFAAGGKAAENVTAPGPEAFFPQTRWEFQPVVEGVEVRHEFTVQNRGTEPLKITNVKTG